MFNNHKIVVTMTSWTKRIGNCFGVIQTILDNTLKPDFVYLNLSLEEFPSRAKSLPVNLVELQRKNPTFKINWVPGPNTKSMKKVFPILPYLDDDDVVITCDDDLDIPSDLIELRVNEFFKHDCKFAISGGTNPKWHLDKVLRSTVYNCLTATSIFMKKMLCGYEQMLCNDVIKTYNDDLTYTLIMLSNGYRVIPSQVISTRSGVTKRKVLFKNEVSPLRGSGICKLDKDTEDIFELQYDKTHDCPFRKRLFNLVVFDSFDIAGDNGEYFYRKAREICPDINMTFLLSRNSKDWDRLQKDGFNIYPFEGQELEWILKWASFILWSKDVPNMGMMRSLRSKSIFLQHGITNRFHNIESYMASTISQYSQYILCSSDDESHVVSDLSKSKLCPLTIGLPRHDSLLCKSEYYNKHKTVKQVFISFHWRRGKYDKNQEAFVKSRYLLDIRRLLACETFRDMARQGVRFVFLPHARFMKYLNFFEIPSYIEVPKYKPFQDVLVESDVLITDFSSNSFEMAYMGKPTVAFIPGIEYVKKYMTHYNIDALKSYDHILYCGDSIPNVTSTVHELIQNDAGHQSYAHDTFKYVDTNNSKRLLDWMLNKCDIK